MILVFVSVYPFMYQVLEAENFRQFLGNVMRMQLKWNTFDYINVMNLMD